MVWDKPEAVPASEALLPCCSSQHPYHQLHPRCTFYCGPAARGNLIIINRLPKETPHCFWVSSVVFSDACSDSTYTEHHLLHPLLAIMLAKSRSQAGWASYLERRLCLSSVEPFDRLGRQRDTSVEVLFQTAPTSLHYPLYVFSDGEVKRQTCMVQACYASRQPLQNHPSGYLEGWSAEYMLDGQHQRVDIPAHARPSPRASCRKD